jgi:methionyl-tRNA synthetase
MQQRPKYYLTTAISYPNGAPHIGHAYELIATDAIARYHRLAGYDVFMLTGTDEHGQKMVQTAERAGVPVQDLAEKNAARFRAMGTAVNASNDRFIRTTEPQHYAASQEIWRRMLASGDIYLGSYAGWYSVRDEAFFADSELTITADGARLSPQGTPVEWVEEKSYFFRLSAFQERLLELYERVPNFIGPDSRRKEVLSFVRGGLQDLSISRTTFSWGVPVPDDPAHVMYVWVDALTNYLTGVGFPDERAPEWQRWPADVHIIGKDIVRFHTVYWPAFLMSAGLPLPKRVFCHGFLFNRGEKMSKSVGNVIDPFVMAQHYGIDAVRYFLLREVPFGQDGSYSHEAIVSRINADLANDLGNLAQRSLSMIGKNCNGQIPACGDLTDADREILTAAARLPELAENAMGNFALHTILADIWAVVGAANRYFAGEEPWLLRKTNPVRMETVLYVTAEVLRHVGIMVQPFVPAAAARLLDLLAVADDQRLLAHCTEAYRLVSGTSLPGPAPVFPRYVEQDDEDAVA